MESNSDKTGEEESDEWIGKVFVTTTFDAYRNFFDGEWAKKIDQLTKGKRGIRDITLDLIMEWQAAAYTASLPVTIIDHMEAYHNAFVNTGEINTILLTLAEVIPGRLSRDLPELNVDPALLRRIRERLNNSSTEPECHAALAKECRMSR